MLIIYTTVGSRLCQQVKNGKTTYQHLKGPSVAAIALHPYQNSQNHLNFAINNGISSSASLLSFFKPSRANLSSNHSDQPIYKKYTFSKTWPYLHKEPLRDRVLSKRPDIPSTEDTARLWKYYIKVRTFYSAWARTGVMLVCIVATTSISMSITQMRDYLLKASQVVKDLEKKMVGSIIDFIEAGHAAWVMVRVVGSVLASASDSATLGALAWWRPRVASLLADLAAHANRRKAVVGSRNGLVVDWLLKAVGGGRPACAVTQAEASRALAHMLSDKNTCEAVLGRPHALPYLLHFAATIKPEEGFESLKGSKKKNVVPQDGGNANNLHGKSQLVAAIMELVTASYHAEANLTGFRPMLPGNADPNDVATTLKVVGGGWVPNKDNLGGGDKPSSQLILDSKPSRHVKEDVASKLHPQMANMSITTEDDLVLHGFKSLWLFSREFTHGGHYNHEGVENKASPTARIGSKRGLHESSHNITDNNMPGRYVAVSLAAWALAAWAQTSRANRAIMSQLDREGEALLAAVRAPERIIRFHVALVMKYLLLHKVDLQMNVVTTRWTSTILAMAAQTGNSQDLQLAQLALTNLTACVSSNPRGTENVITDGLPTLRKLAKQTRTDARVQGALAHLLDKFTGSGNDLSEPESHKWSPILLSWVCHQKSETATRACGCRILTRLVNKLDRGGIPISQAWLAMLLMDIVSDTRIAPKPTKKHKARNMVQSERLEMATGAATQLAKVVALEAAAMQAATKQSQQVVAESAAELPMVDLLGFDVTTDLLSTSGSGSSLPKVTAGEAALATLKAIKALTELTAEEPEGRQRIIDAGGIFLLRRLLLCNDFGNWVAAEVIENTNKNTSSTALELTNAEAVKGDKPPIKKPKLSESSEAVIAHIQKHAARLLLILSLQLPCSLTLGSDPQWCAWLEDCADGKVSQDIKVRSYARIILLHIVQAKEMAKKMVTLNALGQEEEGPLEGDILPRYEDGLFIMNPLAPCWKVMLNSPTKQAKQEESDPTIIDVVFVHGLRGGPFRTWRIAEEKDHTSIAAIADVLVDKIDVDAGKKGTCWPEEWLSGDLPCTRLITLKYKTNLSQWSGATLPLREVSLILLDKLLAAGVGERPTVFVTHSMGGLVVKQMLLQAGLDDKRAHFVDNTYGIVFYSTPHFGSKLADMPWGVGYVFRPAPTVGELRSGSPRLEELNRNIGLLHNKGHLRILSFSETSVTPLVEGYGGYALRMEVVPIESAYPGFGDLVVLAGIDHINSCKPHSKSDPAYRKTLEFLQNIIYQTPDAKLKSRH